MQLGKRERQDVKALALVAGKREVDRERDRQREREQLELASMHSSLDSRGERIAPDGMPQALADRGPNGLGEWLSGGRGLRATGSLTAAFLSHSTGAGVHALLTGTAVVREQDAAGPGDAAGPHVAHRIRGGACEGRRPGLRRAGSAGYRGKHCFAGASHRQLREWQCLLGSQLTRATLRRLTSRQ